MKNIPIIEDILLHWLKEKDFKKIDLSQAYQQLIVDERSCKLCDKHSQSLYLYTHFLLV